MPAGCSWNAPRNADLRAGLVEGHRGGDLAEFGRGVLDGDVLARLDPRGRERVEEPEFALAGFESALAADFHQQEVADHQPLLAGAPDVRRRATGIHHAVGPRLDQVLETLVGRAAVQQLVVEVLERGVGVAHRQVLLDHVRGDVLVQKQAVPVGHDALGVVLADAARACP